MRGAAKYRRWYRDLVVRSAGRVHTPGLYERHHVFPKSLGGSNAKSNIAFLTYREHFLAHWLLIKFTRGQDKGKMCFALHRLTFSRGKKTIRTAWQYEVVRRSNSDGVRAAWKNPEFRKRQVRSRAATWSKPETRARMSEGAKRGWDDPEKRKKQGETHRRMWTPERRASWSIRMKDVLSDPKIRKKLSIAIKKSCEKPERRVQLAAAGRIGGSSFKKTWRGRKRA